jgi:hypothetical protein
LDGSTYAFAFSVSGVGLLLYFINIFLIRWFIIRRSPEMADELNWESTAGKGIVPKWVSEIGLLGIAFVPSGLVVALLLVLDIVQHR